MEQEINVVHKKDENGDIIEEVNYQTIVLHFENSKTYFWIELKKISEGYCYCVYKKSKRQIVRHCLLEFSIQQIEKERIIKIPAYNLFVVLMPTQELKIMRMVGEKMEKKNCRF